ncbi:hypothetical protein CONPUDRAFT_105225 [Coniophora puteana RWD-64-598 SS2]|uniref:BTB domain-containing protein n=1 Tax=Coniophora puteana (strain RWD-64-598) TaxID=741705 RepID=A0A5M3MM04_CONPW|nr:uncharacterized protein CONPUDRAFT_105225 [Coniophora puteana RWD-64-598 SS2]EIW80262.1 hypothetical protein CONPUDRAFT_105225 [Coniophora puteana RWD-64-598 SS2]
MQNANVTAQQLPTPPPSTLLPSPLPLPNKSQAQDPPLNTAPRGNEPTVEDSGMVSVSTTFFPGSQTHLTHPDLIIISSDSIFFYVESIMLLSASSNAFGALFALPAKHPGSDAGPIVVAQEHSAILDVILHTIYNMSCSHHNPSFDSLSAAVMAFPKYGLSTTRYIVPSTPLYTLLLSHAPLRPLQLYALAAQYDLHDLAVPTSSHLLSFSLPSLTDDMADRIGSRYLRRLFFLHLGRTDALKRILLQPPHPHAPSPTCSFEDQNRVSRAWALASAYLAWDARPDLSTAALQAALGPLGEKVRCSLCREGLQERLKNVITEWIIVKRTI